ncbi:peroxiredoxin [Kangiella taiwanensis]|uniref:thioredoxin-dependent peroxiredoxin n=1 Tax=Kangiella taiwanensis TaxID=1079179 RepID=A0ABP8I852_9GAMM|nr:peroxiredoxin [Kangiella taiwanensis]
MSRILLVVFGLLLSANVAVASNWVGALAPTFELEDQNGETKSLEDYKGQWLVLYFYPKDDTPGCTTEAKNFRDKYLEYQALNAEIVGISLDDVSSHKDFSNAYKLPFTILADVNQEASKAYKVLGGFGPMEYAERETFVIDPQGNIVYHYPDVDPDTHAEEVYKQLKILQKELEG